jgi:hypothetical protein
MALSCGDGFIVLALTSSRPCSIWRGDGALTVGVFDVAPALRERYGHAGDGVLIDLTSARQAAGAPTPQGSMPPFDAARVRRSQPLITPEHRRSRRLCEN